MKTQFHVRALAFVVKRTGRNKPAIVGRTLNVGMYVTAKDESAAVVIAARRIRDKHDATLFRAVALPVL